MSGVPVQVVVFIGTAVAQAMVDAGTCILVAAEGAAVFLVRQHKALAYFSAEMSLLNASLAEFRPSCTGAGRCQLWICQLTQPGSDA